MRVDDRRRTRKRHFVYFADIGLAIAQQDFVGVVVASAGRDAVEFELAVLLVVHDFIMLSDEHFAGRLVEISDARRGKSLTFVASHSLTVPVLQLGRHGY